MDITTLGTVVGIVAICYVIGLGMSAHCIFWPESVDGTVLANQEMITRTGPAVLQVPAVDILGCALGSFRVMQDCSCSTLSI